MKTKDFEKQIAEFFELKTLPVYVPGHDIIIGEDEIIYRAKKLVASNKGVMIENENWDWDSVAKPRYVPKPPEHAILDFVIREGRVYIIRAKRT